VHNPDYVINGGKTIVGALIGGLITVELMKRYIGLRVSTGDLYAIPLALGIAIGRIGCFLTGLSDNTYGAASNLPWAINFGDGIPRHPTQLYEAIFLLILIPLLYRTLRRTVILSGASSNELAESKDPVSLRSATGPSRNFLLAPRDSGRGTRPGDAFKLFMVAYASFRFLCDFIKPYPRIFLGLGGIQWACVLLLLYYASDIARWLRSMSARDAASA